jgi:hypothetical protein
MNSPFFVLIFRRFGGTFKDAGTLKKIRDIQRKDTHMQTPLKAASLALVGAALLSFSVMADEGEGQTGPTVNLSANVTDTSGGTLQYRWKSTDGSIRNVNSSHTTWTLPAGHGLHFAYVLVSNDLGGYTQRRVVVSTDNQPAVRSGESDATSLKPPAAPAQVNDFYRGFLILGQTPDYIDLYAANLQVFLQDATTLTRYPATGVALTNPRGEYLIAGVPPDDNLNANCSADGGVSFQLCNQQFTQLDSATTDYFTHDAATYMFLPDGSYGPSPTLVTGSVALADGSVCGMVDEFFGVHTLPTVTMFNASNTPLGSPIKVNEFGYFSFQLNPSAATALVRCDHSSRAVMLNTSSATSGTIALGPITFASVTPPTVVSLTATLNGAVVGSLLPPPTGFPSDALARSDGYLSEKGIDTRAGACQYYKAIGGVQNCDSNGNFMGAKLTYDQWQRAEHIGPYARAGTPQYKALYINKVDLNLTRDHTSISYSPNQTAAVVCNHLGPPGTTPAQLMNPAPGDIETAISNTANGKNLVACVAMDYKAYPGVNNGQPFTRFFIFGPDGSLLPSINLDGRSEKYVPGTCIACHGGDHYAEKFPENGSGPANVGGHFLPYDVGNFEFSQTQAGLTEPEQREQIYHLNQNVLRAGPTVAEQELIAGWYANDPVTCPASDPRCHVLDTSYLPVSWSTSQIIASEAAAQNTPLLATDIQNLQSLYKNVLARSCRTCHVAQIENYNFDHFNNALAPSSYSPYGQNSSLEDAAFEIKRNVCGRAYSSETFSSLERWNMMPNSLVTFNRFWLSANPLYGQVDQTAIFNAYEALDFNDPCVAPSY